MRLEVGKKYRNALGEIRGPIRDISKVSRIGFKFEKFTDELGNWYGADGHYWQQQPDCPFRLVEEVSELPILSSNCNGAPE